MTDNHPDRPSSWDPGPLRPALPAYPQAPRGYQPLFPPAPPGLFPTPADPLVSADFNGWWGRSFRLLKAVWRQAALVQLLWAAPLLVAGAVASPALARLYTELLETPETFRPDWSVLVYVIPLGLLLGLLSLLAQLATLHLVVQAALGRPLSVAGALRAAGPRLPAYVGWGLLGGLLMLVGLVLCFVPGYYVSAVLTILPAVVMMERGGALPRCFRLFHARVGDSLARIATMIGVGAAVSIAGQALFGVVFVLDLALSDAGLSAAGLFADIALTLGVTGITQVVLAPMTMTAYADMRARHEPFSAAYVT